VEKKFIFSVTPGGYQLDVAMKLTGQNQDYFLEKYCAAIIKKYI
jgi:hypothetical protein